MARGEPDTGDAGGNDRGKSPKLAATFPSCLGRCPYGFVETYKGTFLGQVRSGQVRSGQNPAVIFVNCHGFWPTPLQLSETPPPGQGRSRLTDQNASRDRPLLLAYPTIRCQVVVDTCSCWSVTPFIPEMPM